MFIFEIRCVPSVEMNKPLDSLARQLLNLFSIIIVFKIGFEVLKNFIFDSGRHLCPAIGKPLTTL